MLKLHRPLLQKKYENNNLLLQGFDSDKSSEIKKAFYLFKQKSSPDFDVDGKISSIKKYIPQ